MFGITPRRASAITIFCRILGAFWVLCGFGMMASYFLDARSEGILLATAIFGIVAGLGFIFVKPVPVTKR